MKSLLEYAVEHNEMLNKPLLEAYSIFYKKERRWLRSEHESKTLQNLIDDACDKLEADGYDLNVTTTDVVFNHIAASIKVRFHIPDGYLALEEAREETLAILEEYETSSVRSDELEQALRKSLHRIELQMKKLAND